MPDDLRMALFEIMGRRLEPGKVMTFAELGLRERQDLQELLFAQIDALGEDLMVIAQEYGNWEDARRRLDLLAVDRDRHLVVIELKRTEDAGHAELQALRYAAMVATLTFDEVLAAYEATLGTPAGRVLQLELADPREELLAFLGFGADEEPVLSSQVRIVLCSANYSRELTTAVLWLNGFDGMDIRCVRLRPYAVGDRVMLDAQQLIPLPETADYQVRMRRKEAERERATGDSRDLTRYVVTVDGADIGEFNKRNTVRVVIEQLASRGIPVEQIAAALPSWAIKAVEGDPRTREELSAAVATATGTRPDRYFLGHPLRADGRTWVVSLAWGANAEPTLTSLLATFPTAGIAFRSAE